LQAHPLKLGDKGAFFIDFLTSKIDFLSTFQAEKIDLKINATL